MERDLVHVPVPTQRSSKLSLSISTALFFLSKENLLPEVSWNWHFISFILSQENVDILADYFFLTDSTDYFIFFDPTCKIYAASLTDPTTKEVHNFQYNFTENQSSQKHHSR